MLSDDLVVIADSLEECISKLRVWRAGMESKCLRVNMKKTKFLISGVGLNLLQDSGAIPLSLYVGRIGRQLHLGHLGCLFGLAVGFYPGFHVRECKQ